MHKEPLLSIITTVYNCEEYLPRCIESVLNSTYKNIEFIIVDDKSPGNVAEIVERYKDFPRIRFVQNAENLGLFHARLAGAAVATGDYLEFIDADDHVSVDYYRTLMERALETDSDLVLGNLVNEYDEPSLHYSLRKTSKVRKNILDLRGDSIKDLYFASRGLEPEVNYLVTKLIRRDLWDKCLPYFMSVKGHIVNTEDVLFSSVLYYFATHLTNCHNDFYHYYQRKSSSLNQKRTYSVINRNILNNKQVFTFILDFCKEKKLERYIKPIWEWYLHYMNYNRTDIERADLSHSEKKELSSLIDEIPFPEDISLPAQENAYLFAPNSFSCAENLLGEELKERICDAAVEVVSFDVFDTLVTRPFFYPTDLFYLLEEFANGILGITDKMRFKEMRVEAEKLAREKVMVAHPMYEDINLDEVYDALQDMTGFSDETISALKEKELALELECCRQRKYSKELFDLAKHLGKKVVIASDMYLKKDFLEKLLANCGYNGYDALYVSSEARITKWSGKLFKRISEDFKVKPCKILHIGDNKESDILSAQNCGLKAAFIPRTVSVLTNEAGSPFYAGECVSKVYRQSFLGRRAGVFNEFFGTRCLLAVVANKLFDNPFVPWDKNSDFNASPAVIGYFPLGMHLFALAKWLHEETKSENYSQINFMARDGYLPMEAFKILNKVYHNPTQINYLHLSRTTVFPIQIQSGNDVFSVGTNLSFHVVTPKMIISLLESVVFDEKLENIKEICEKNGFLYGQHFPSQRAFSYFLRFFKEQLFSQEKSDKYRDAFKSNFSQYFEGKTATFDIGYSCRIESLMKEIFACDITPYYVHINNDTALSRAQKKNIEIKTFLNYEPGVTGLQRELFISSVSPKIVSYRSENDKFIPVTDELEYNQTEQEIISEIQASALDFVSDIVQIFGENIKYLFFAREYASLPFEYFLACPKYSDRQLFSVFEFKDELGTSEKIIEFNALWDMQLKNMYKETQSVELIYIDFKGIKQKWLKFLYFLCTDRKVLKEKVRQRLRNHKVLLFVSKKIYGGLRAVKNIFRRKA